MSQRTFSLCKARRCEIYITWAFACALRPKSLLRCGFVVEMAVDRETRVSCLVFALDGTRHAREHLDLEALSNGIITVNDVVLFTAVFIMDLLIPRPPSTRSGCSQTTEGIHGTSCGWCCRITAQRYCKRFHAFFQVLFTRAEA